MDLWDRVLGFMDAQAVMVAEELGVFERLDRGSCGSAELAEATGLSDDTARRLLTMLAAMGLVQRSASGWANAEQAARQLVRGRPGYIGAMFQHLRRDVYPLWGQAREALLSGEAQWERLTGTRTNERMFEDPQALRQFMQGMHAITLQSAVEFAGLAAELGQMRHVVDIGGASGAFLIALAARHPQLRGTLFDLPQVQPIAQDHIRAAGLQDRIDVQAGDFWRDPLPAGADAYALGFILHDWDTAAGSLLLDKVAEASRPGGWLVVGELLLHDDRTGPLWTARSDLNMLVTAQGRERTAAEYAEWLGGFGFVLQRSYPTSLGKNFLVFRFRP